MLGRCQAASLVCTGVQAQALATQVGPSVSQRKERIREQKKWYYEQNKKRLLEYQKQYYSTHRAESRNARSERKRKERSTVLKRDRSQYNRELLKKSKSEFIVQLTSSTSTKEKILRELNVKEPHDWYGITSTQLRAFPEGNKIRKYFKREEFLKLLYPDFKWVEGNFKRVSRGSWLNKSHIREFLKTLEGVLYLKSPDEWHRVSNNQIRHYGGYGLIMAFGNLYNALKFAFPEYKLDPDRFLIRSKKSNQKLLESILHTVFPGYEIKESFLHPELSWNGSGKMELDLWLPSKKLAFEYQGEQHYHELGDIFGPHGSLYSYMARDNKKRIECEKAGISLAVVPYWWDGEQASLSDLLREENILH